MTQQQFFWIQLGVAAFIAAIFLWGRRGKPTSPSFRLKAKASEGNLNTSTSKGMSLRRQAGVSQEARAAQNEFVDNLKVLNVIFMYNGHSFDAYEVLNVPPGSNFEVIREAFNKSVMDRPSQKEFLTVAMSAIIEEYKKAASNS